MTRAVRTFLPVGLLLAAVVMLAACQTATGGLGAYDPSAAERTATLKVETRNLMQKSGERYARHASEVEALTARIETAYELAAASPNNQLVAQQWAILRNPEGALYGGFVERWRESGTLGAAYREQKTEQVAAAFDLILCLENAKRQPLQCGGGGR